ncbi:hypothetical protein HMPREF9587_01335 [Cutibacterium acnes HL025PA1]|nr:hypothetical protein HMPREF9587_01335 [Cutibacterium acnes HL025PA1]
MGSIAEWDPADRFADVLMVGAGCTCGCSLSHVAEIWLCVRLICLRGREERSRWAVPARPTFTIAVEVIVWVVLKIIDVTLADSSRGSALGVIDLCSGLAVPALKVGVPALVAIPSLRVLAGLPPLLWILGGVPPLLGVLSVPALLGILAIPAFILSCWLAPSGGSTLASPTIAALGVLVPVLWVLGVLIIALLRILLIVVIVRIRRELLRSLAILREFPGWLVISRLTTIRIGLLGGQFGVIVARV